MIRQTSNSQIHYSYLLQSSLYFKEINAINDLFKENNINFLFLKGLPLHLYYQNNIPSRFFADSDLLIHPDDIPKAYSLFEKRGYQKIRREFSIIHELVRNEEKAEESYIKTISSVPIEFDIHREVVFSIPKIGKIDPLYPNHLISGLTSLFLEGKKYIQVMHHSLPILKADHLIVYLALHLFNHDYKGEFRYILLDKVTRREYVKNSNKIWMNMLHLIQEYKLQNYIYPSFFLLDQRCKTPIPEFFINNIQSSSLLVSAYQRIKFYEGFKVENHQVAGGVKRFLNLLILSKEKLSKKMLVIFQPSVFLLILWVFSKIPIFILVKIKSTFYKSK